MKTVFGAKNAWLLLLVFLFVVACQTDDESSDSANQTLTIDEVTTTASGNSWRVQSYIDSGTDETSDFSGYTFDFGSDGKITATNGTTSLEGSWSITDSSNSSDDDSSDDDDLDFNIAFAVSDDHDFDDLNDDWDILEITANKMALKDVSGGDGSTDLLTFVKN